MNKGNKNLKIGIKEDYYREIIKKINFSQINSGKVLVQTVERSLIRWRIVLKDLEKSEPNGLIKILRKMKLTLLNKISN